jgi:hypothetical protein
MLVVFITLLPILVTGYLRATRKSDTYARPHPHQIHCAQMSCHDPFSIIDVIPIFRLSLHLIVLQFYLIQENNYSIKSVPDAIIPSGTKLIDFTLI